jgi:hypothetical protein
MTIHHNQNNEDNGTFEPEALRFPLAAIAVAPESFS